MRTFGNYGAVSEFQQSTYAYGGLDLSGALASQVVSESSKLEAMNKHNSARINAPPHRQACAAMGSPSRVSTRGYNLLSQGLLTQKTEMIMEVTEKPSGKSQSGDMEITPTIKQQTNSSERQNQSQPQIYPWMTKLHISHGKVASNVFFFTTIVKLRISYFRHSIPCRSVLSILSFLSFIGQKQEIIKLTLVNFITKAPIARKPVPLL